MHLFFPLPPLPPSLSQDEKSELNKTYFSFICPQVKKHSQILKSNYLLVMGESFQSLEK